MVDIPDAILADPALAVLLTAAVRAAVAYQRGLTYPEYRLAHLIKCRAFGLLDPLATRYGRPLVARKGPPGESPEYVRTVDGTPRDVAAAIRDVFSGHLIATAKRREGQWAHSQWRQVHNGQQTEVYLFTSPGGTDVYAHVEDKVEDPEGHLRDEQYPGDHLGAFASAYDGATA